jgi:hypothetical protein
MKKPSSKIVSPHKASRSSFLLFKILFIPSTFDFRRSTFDPFPFNA